MMTFIVPCEIVRDKPYLKVKAGKQYHTYYERIHATLILDNEQRSSTAKLFRWLHNLLPIKRFA